MELLERRQLLSGTVVGFEDLGDLSDFSYTRVLSAGQNNAPLSWAAGHDGYVMRLGYTHHHDGVKFSPSGENYLLSTGTISVDTRLRYYGSAASGANGTIPALILKQPSANANDAYMVTLDQTGGTLRLIIGAAKDIGGSREAYKYYGPSDGHSAYTSITLSGYTPVLDNATHDLGWYTIAASVSGVEGGSPVTITAKVTAPEGTSYYGQWSDTGSSAWRGEGMVGVAQYSQWSQAGEFDNFTADDEVTLFTPPTVSIEANVGSVNEGSSAPAAYTLRRTGATAGDLRVNVAIHGSAGMDDLDDYTLDPLPQGVGNHWYTIPAGQDHLEIALNVKTDEYMEGDEISILQLQPGNGYSLSATSAEVAIKDMTLDLDIFKPRVIDPNEALIAESDEMSIGSATFVNLDNDDNDSQFDDTDSVIAGGDDELVKIHLTVPNSAGDGTLRLVATSGADDIRVWRRNTADASSGYDLGDDLVVSQDLVVEGNHFAADLWIEGIHAQATQQATVLSLELSVAGNTVTDDVALTVIGIDHVEWVGYDNAIDDGNTLDADPNWPTGLAPGAKRVFPDKRVFPSGDSYAQDPDPRTIVHTGVTLSVGSPIAVNVYMRVFDVDDPSADSDAVDSESTAADNRGTTFGWQASGVTPSADVIRELAFAAGETHKQADYIVSSQPGDNFRLVANADEDFLLRLNNNDNELNVGGASANANKQRIVTQDIPINGDPIDREVRQADKYCSDILTVWRFLHVERDSMSALPAGDNQISGTVSDIVGLGTALTQIRTPTNLADGSNDLDTASPNTASGRFENGTLILGGGTTAVTISSITGNGTKALTSRLVFPAASIAGLSFHAVDNDNFWNGTMDGTMTEVTKSGSSFIWTLNITAHNEDPIDWDDFLDGGVLQVGGGGNMTITAVNTAASQVTTDSLSIPFTVRDDDTAILPSLPDTNLMLAKFQPAYIVPVFDGGGNPAHDTTNVAPQAHVSLNTAADIAQYDAILDGPGAFQSENFRKNDYWIACILSAFEPNASVDNDPASENQTYGVTWGMKNAPVGTASRASMVFVETMADAAREKRLTTAEADVDAQLTVVHEIGHQFYIPDETGPRGNNLYSYADLDDPTQNPKFLPVHLNIIRSQVASPGR